jgi:hypothetical protein
MWHFHWRYRLQFGLLGCALVLLTGCGTIPDLKGLADATGEMRSGVVAIGNEYAASIPDDLDKCGGANCKRKFEAAWISRTAAVAAISDYSDALAQVAAAGKDGAERADQVLTSANNLLGALSVAPLSAPVIGIAKIGLTELAKFRALRSMSEAVDAAHVPVSEVLKILDQDLAALDQSSQEIKFGLSALAESEDKDQAGASLERAKSASAALRNVIAADFSGLKQDVENLAALRKNQPAPHAGACKSESQCVQELQATDKRIGESRSRLAALEQDLVSFQAAYAPVQAKKDGISNQAAHLHAAIVQLRSGLQEWISIHRKLGDDIKRGLQPNVRQLIETAGELKKLVNEMRKAP